MGVFLLGTIPGLQAYVWCVKEAGSTALELGAHGECAPSSPQHCAPHSHSDHNPECCNTSGHPHDDTCDLCIDVPLDTELSKTSAPQFKKISSASQIPQWQELQRLRDLSPQLASMQLPHPPPHVSTTLQVQRTTVLII